MGLRKTICFVSLVMVLTAAGQGRAAGDELVPMTIKRLLLVNEAPAVLLMDEGERQFLLVFIDFFMANAIRVGMEEPELARPLTHDLIGIFLRQFGATVEKIAITELKNNTYYALITLQVNGGASEIDARPSDALAIAVRQHAPIFAAQSLLKSVSESQRRMEEERRGAPRLIPEEKPRAST